MSILTINGVGLDTIDIATASVGDLYSYSGVSRNADAIPGRLGQFPVERAVGRARVLPVELRIKPSSVAARQAARDQLLSLLVGRMRLEWSDQPGRVYWCRVDGATIRPTVQSIPFLNGRLTAQVDFIVDSGVSEDKDIRILSLPADEDIPLDLGTAGSEGVVLCEGQAHDYTLTLKARGETVGTALNLDNSDGPQSGEVMEIDWARSEPRIMIHVQADNGRTRENALYETGDFPTFDPSLLNPTLRSSHDATLYYRRFYK